MKYDFLFIFYLNIISFYYYIILYLMIGKINIGDINIFGNILSPLFSLKNINDIF